MEFPGSDLLDWRVGIQEFTNCPRVNKQITGGSTMFKTFPPLEESENYDSIHLWAGHFPTSNKVACYFGTACIKFQVSTQWSYRLAPSTNAWSMFPSLPAPASQPPAVLQSTSLLLGHPHAANTSEPRDEKYQWWLVGRWGWFFSAQYTRKIPARRITATTNQAWNELRNLSSKAIWALGVLFVY